MKKLKCEMCGSSDLVKEDGMFICQSCGCKYSAEEAKKLMIEGTVDVQGTVKVDDSAKVGNYLTMANNAYEAGNKEEAESYCNKIIEIEPENFEVWFLKGKAAGWQSTLANLRIQESITCFSKAIENAPDDKVEELKANVAEEVTSLSTALMQLCCDNFEKYVSDNSANDILGGLDFVKNCSELLELKCGVKPTDYYKTIAAMISAAANSAYSDNIWKEYNAEADPSKYDAETFVNGCMNCIVLLQKAIEFADDDSTADFDRYKSMIKIMSAMINRGYYNEYSVDKGKDISYPFIPYDKQQGYKNLIQSYHEKMHEIDPSYEVPKQSGCYVATAVYGSYDCPQVWTLRRFRDYTLADTWYGRLFIHVYYAISPTLVKWFGDTKWFKKLWKGKLDKMVNKLKSEGVKDTPYEDKVWR